MNMQSNLSFEEICDLYEACYEFMHDAGDVLMHFDGVVGIGVGPKEMDGELNPDLPCFIVYVTEKKPMAELEAKAYIPREFDGISTDVVEVGSRKREIHNEFDLRWIALSKESFSSFFPPKAGCYQKAS
ncbi:hypothetical protein ACFL2V_07545 [Pseudomonadota bacterium]